MQRNIFLRLLFLIAMLLLLLPLLFAPFDRFRGRELQSVNRSNYSFSHFKWNRFFENEFQENIESSCKNRVGLGNTWVRMYNELMFRVFRYSKTSKLVLGKDNCFYEEFYIDAYLGRNFIGDEFVRSKVEELKLLQQILLDSCNIYLLPVFEPGKAHFAPEYIPDYYHPEIKTTSNYERYIFYCDEFGVNYLDLNHYFSELKIESPYLLYSKYGVHWSTYGMCKAVDTLISFIERSCYIDLPNIVQVGDSNSVINNDLDFDLEPPMNLYYTLPHEKMYFPIRKYVTNEKTVRPKVLTIGDSYYWSIMNSKVSENLFQSNDYWYYNRTAWPNIFSESSVVPDSVRREVIMSQNIILLMITDANLYNFGWGFIETTLPMVLPGYQVSMKIQKLYEILGNSYYYDKIKHESIRREISFEEVLREYVE